MEDFEKKVKITESMEIEATADEESNNNSSKTLLLLRRFLAVQQRRAQAYAKLKRYAFFSFIFLQLNQLKFHLMIFAGWLWAITFMSNSKIGIYLLPITLNPEMGMIEWTDFQPVVSGFNFMKASLSGLKGWDRWVKS